MRVCHVHTIFLRTYTQSSVHSQYGIKLQALLFKIMNDLNGDCLLLECTNLSRYNILIWFWRWSVKKKFDYIYFLRSFGFNYTITNIRPTKLLTKHCFYYNDQNYKQNNKYWYWAAILGVVHMFQDIYKEITIQLLLSNPVI